MTSIPKLVNSIIKKNNICTVFGYSGGSIMPIINTFYKDDVKLIVNSNEQCVGHSATSYAKTTNKTGVALVTSGPGITNMLTSMLDATQDSTPMVVISGQVSLNAVGTNAFQEAPAVDLSKYSTKWSYQIKENDDVSYILNKAFFVANDKKKGCVHIDIPKCLMKKNDYKETNYEKNNVTFKNYDYRKIIKMINNSKKPILLVGKGCIPAYKLLREVSVKGNIPVTSTIHGCGIVNETHPLSLGWCGMHGTEVSNYCIQSSDCIINIGSRFDDRITGNVDLYAPQAIKSQKKNNGGIIHVNIESSELTKVVNSKYNFNLDSKTFLKNIIKYIEYNPRKNWFNYIENIKNQYKKETNTEILNMETVLTKLYDMTYHLNEKNKLIFTTGVGNHQMQTYKYIKSHYPGTIYSSGSLGVMGCGLPYSIGAKLANPDKTVILVDGDSSFNMTSSDLKTVVENNIPVKILIMNNNSQMMVQAWEKLFFDNRITATVNKRNPDFVKLGESYGIKSISCSNIKDLRNSIRFILSYRGPILCEFKIEKDICFPIVPPGNSIDNMIHSIDELSNKDIAPS